MYASTTTKSYAALSSVYVQQIGLFHHLICKPIRAPSRPTGFRSSLVVPFNHACSHCSEPTKTPLHSRCSFFLWCVCVCVPASVRPLRQRNLIENAENNAKHNEIAQLIGPSAHIVRLESVPQSATMHSAFSSKSANHHNILVYSVLCTVPNTSSGCEAGGKCNSFRHECTPNNEQLRRCTCFATVSMALAVPTMCTHEIDSELAVKHDWTALNAFRNWVSALDGVELAERGKRTRAGKRTAKYKKPANRCDLYVIKYHVVHT